MAQGARPFKVARRKQAPSTRLPEQEKETKKRRRQARIPLVAFGSQSERDAKRSLAPREKPQKLGPPDEIGNGSKHKCTWRPQVKKSLVPFARASHFGVTLFFLTSHLAKGGFFSESFKAPGFRLVFSRLKHEDPRSFPGVSGFPGHSHFCEGSFRCSVHRFASVLCGPLVEAKAASNK